MLERHSDDSTSHFTAEAPFHLDCGLTGLSHPCSEVVIADVGDGPEGDKVGFDITGFGLYEFFSCSTRAGLCLLTYCARA